LRKSRLIECGGIKKPSYVAFSLLHKLGSERLANAASDVLVTRRKDGTLVIAAWNLVDPDQKGPNKVFHLKFLGVAPNARISVQRVDNEHGNTLAAYRAIGSPRYPTPAQVQQINRAAELPPADSAQLLSGRLDLDISPNGLVLVEASPAAALP
jgi:xylan 1,4-beta-xylosidase